MRADAVLTGKRLLVTGVATPESIAFATARRCLEMGADVVLTAYPRDHAATTALAATLGHVDVLPLDLTEPSQADAVIARVRDTLGGLDGALHAVAYAPAGALGGLMIDADPAGVEVAFRTSAWSLAGLARIVADLAPPTGASLVGLDFDAGDRAWPVYNWMGVCKAALKATSRYLARDHGAAAIRVNLVSAGPLHTRAAGGIPGFEQLLRAWESTAPLAWDPTDPAPVADTACFLLSDLARAITGEVIHVDGGYHAMAAPGAPQLGSPPASSRAAKGP